MRDTKNFSGFEILIMLLVGVLLSGCSGSADNAAVRQANPRFVESLESIDADTNILVVSFDALRADALGVYGYDGGTSPTIDRWADQAFVFEQFYSAAQATPTSFAAAFTGQYPFRVFRAWNLADTQTLAEVMQNSGRNTFAVLNNVQLVSERNFDQGFDVYEVLSSPREQDVVEAASVALEEHADSPFFGWIHFISPHTPYTYRELASDSYSPGYSGPYESDSGVNPAPVSKADARRLRELYDGEVFFADMLFERILAELSRLQLTEKTLVILTADHGDQFGEKGGYGHKTVYEGVIRIPFLVRPPGGLEQGVRIRRVHVNTDLLPTLAVATGTEFVATADGVDMAADVSEERVTIFTSMTNNDHRKMAVRHRNDKLIVSCPPPEFREELFLVGDDPLEQTDRILDDPERAGQVFDLLVAHIGGDPCDVIQGALRGAKITNNLDDATIEKLRSLGYIQ